MSIHIPSMHHHANLFPWSCRPSLSPHSPVHLPPIKHFDLHVMPPSPPQAIHTRPASPPSPSPQPVAVHPPPMSQSQSSSLASQASWCGPGAESSVPVVAEKTAEMVCYLWFAGARDLVRSSPNSRARFHSRHSPKMDPVSAALQFAPSSRFVQFMRRMLETTQVSQSVIVLSLHYIYRLRQHNSRIAAQPGSEFRVSVVALMLANKFVDDNTYTNKTWSDVAGIELGELNRMEREFLEGVESRLYVDKTTYDSWLQLLKGLVLAKERERIQWQAVLHNADQARHNISHPRYSHHYTNPPHTPSYRPRSTSPVLSSRDNFTFSFRLQNSAARQFSPNHQSMAVEETSEDAGRKRSALAAFDEQLGSRPSKRVITLQTDGLNGLAGPRSAGPSFASSAYGPSHDAFSRLSLNTPAESIPSGQHNAYAPSAVSSQSNVPQTLMLPYEMDQRLSNAQPPHLYFYSLSGSPLENAADNRKTKLHRAPSHPQPGLPKYSLVVPAPLVVHSANASPRDLVLRLEKAQRFPNLQIPRHRFQGIPAEVSLSERTDSHSPSAAHGTYIPAAHFANAGPPGVHWTATTPENRFTYAHAQRRW